MLAHEVEHAFYDAWSPGSGIEEYPRLFRTDQVDEGVSPLYWIFEFNVWVDGDETFWEVR